MNSLTFRMALCLFLGGMVAFPTVANAEAYIVRTDGVDDPERDGQSKQTAWASLAFACEQLPEEGTHTIRLHAGKFIATRPAIVPSGTTIQGSGSDGHTQTMLIASEEWPVTETACEGNLADQSLIAMKNVRDVTVKNIRLASPKQRRISTGLYASRAKGLLIHNVKCNEFRWSGLQLEVCSNVEVARGVFMNCTMERCRFHNGAIRTTYLKHADIHHNYIQHDSGGYGYKAGGHENVRIHHNTILAPYFSIESAHENEYGCEIDHNVMNAAISIPKGGQGADPKSRGYEYSFHIHHNFLQDSYTIEGPRNHLLFEHNYVRIKKDNGRCYAQFGGENSGPVWIRQNVFENVDRSVLWKNRGTAKDVHFLNNTVFCAASPTRDGNIVSVYRGEGIDGWEVKNNLFYAPYHHPRTLIHGERGVPEKIALAGNALVHVTTAPASESGNLILADPQLRREGERPFPFLAPKPDSPLIDAGVDVGLPFEGKAPDIGAFEHGRPGWWRQDAVGHRAEDDRSPEDSPVRGDS